ncbi:unnamed protein product, partial [Oikopleura dioica]
GLLPSIANALPVVPVESTLSKL